MLCDELAVRVDDAGDLVLAAGDCAKARAGLAALARPGSRPAALVDGVPAGADEAIAAHQRVAEASWREAIKGPAGAARLRQLLASVVTPA